jgi:hypothetical protein
MQKQWMLLIFLCVQQIGNAQLIPFGLDLTPRGRIVFSHGEPNYNGNLDEPARVSCDGEASYVWDWRNVKYQFLTIFNFPESQVIHIPIDQPSLRLSDTMILDYKSASVLTFVTGAEVRNPNRFYDEFEGLGLNDSIANSLKMKLTQYIHQYRGKYVSDEILDGLKDQLSETDTIIDDKPVFIYSADRLVFYNYQDTLLTSVIAAYSFGRIEFDSLRYDEAGKMVYFSNEIIGEIRNEYFMEYNQENQLTTVMNQFSDAEDSFKEIRSEITKYGYDRFGEINCRSILHNDGIWRDCFFQKEPFKVLEK